MAKPLVVAVRSRCFGVSQRCFAEAGPLEVVARPRCFEVADSLEVVVMRPKSFGVAGSSVVAVCHMFLTEGMVVDTSRNGFGLVVFAVLDKVIKAH